MIAGPNTFQLPNTDPNGSVLFFNLCSASALLVSPTRQPHDLVEPLFKSPDLTTFPTPHSHKHFHNMHPDLLPSTGCITSSLPNDFPVRSVFASLRQPPHGMLRTSCDTLLRELLPHLSQEQRNSFDLSLPDGICSNTK